jgi:hypothetical protein
LERVREYAEWENSLNGLSRANRNFLRAVICGFGTDIDPVTAAEGVILFPSTIKNFNRAVSKFGRYDLFEAHKIAEEYRKKTNGRPMPKPLDIKDKRTNMHNRLNAGSKRKPYKSNLSQEDIGAILEFWNNPAHTTESPCRCHHRFIVGPDGKKVQVNIRFYQGNMNELFGKFKEQGGEGHGRKIGIRSFQRWKPKNVKKPKASDRASCCCQKHENAYFGIRGMGDSRRQQRDACKACKASRQEYCPKHADDDGLCPTDTFKSLSGTWATGLCPKPEGDTFHNKVRIATWSLLLFACMHKGKLLISSLIALKQWLCDVVQSDNQMLDRVLECSFDFEMNILFG